MDGHRGYYAKWDKSDRERQILCDFTYIWNLKKQNKWTSNQAVTESWASLVAQLVKNMPAMLETWVQSLGWEDTLEKGKATHSNILASTSALLTMPKSLTVWITTNCGKEMGIPDHLTCLLRNLYVGREATVRTGHGTTVSKSGKEYVKAVYCNSAYLTYIRSTSWEMLGWMKHKLNQDCQEKY